MRSLLVFLLASTCYAATYYVAPNGSDGSPGTAAAPFQTVQRGVAVARAGDSVLVRSGKYGHGSSNTGGDGANYAATPVILSNSGLATAWISIKSETKWGAILDCEMICDSYFNLLNASYVSIEGFVITRGFKEGIHSNDAAHHITLRGNRIEFIANRNTSTTLGLSGMYTNPNCHDFLIDGNVFHDIGRTNPLAYDHGLYIRGYNFTVVNNTFYNNTRGWAIQLADGASNVLIANNTFAVPNPDKDGHIMLWNTQSNLTIQNNTFYNPRGYAIDRYASNVNACMVDHNRVFGALAVMADAAGCTVEHNSTGDTEPVMLLELR